MPIAAAIVILGYVFECGKTAIVHVGSRPGDLAQRRSLEISVPGARISQPAITPGDAGVVQPLVGEVGADVAGDAVALSTEECEARLLLRGECGAVTVDEAVEWRVAG